MKKLLLILFLGILLFSCSKDDNNTDTSSSGLSNTPTANAAYDSNNYGVYKGVFVGSSGNVTINIKNDGTLSATLVIDGTSYTYTTTETVTLNAAISGLTFTNGNSHFDFNVDASGNSITISNISIDGHPLATIYVVKEKSNHIVKCYQGTYAGGGTGIFNLITYENEFFGLAKASDGSGVTSLHGSITGSSLTGTIGDQDGTLSGVFVGDTVSGVWHSSTNSDTGTWTGTRKL